jgi:hypothetical protein
LFRTGNHLGGLVDEVVVPPVVLEVDMVGLEPGWCAIVRVRE